MITTSLLALALASTPAEAAGYPAPDPTQPCTMITDPMLAELADTVSLAQRYAARDLAEHYPSGGYPLYTLYNFQTLEDASAEISDLRAWLSTGPGEGDPYAVNYSEASWVMNWVWKGAANPLLYAQWYGVISAIYNDSDDARESAELAGEAAIQAQEIIGYAMQCYSNAYLSSY